MWQRHVCTAAAANGQETRSLPETARMALEPWIVEAALDRLRPILSPADQRIILKATRTPHSVKWPEWWSEHP
jgi:hypothetical protein